jgi:hypothetical protein
LPPEPVEFQPEKENFCKVGFNSGDFVELRAQAFTLIAVLWVMFGPGVWIAKQRIKSI